MDKQPSTHHKLSKQETDFINQSLKALNKNPQSLVFASLSDFFRQKQLYKRALETCLEGLSYNPSCAKGYVVLGSIYLDQARYEKSIQAFEQALALNTKNMLAIRSLIQLYILTRNIPKLKEIYEILILHEPDDPHIQKIVQTLHSAHLRDYNYFSEKNIETVEEDLSSIELQKRPTIKPRDALSKKPLTHQKAFEDIQQLISPPTTIPQHTITTSKEKREKQLGVLNNLLDQLNN